MTAIEKIIERFGGLSEMARALSHRNPTTVQGWRDRKCVPSRHIPTVIEAAKDHGIKLTHADFFTAPRERRNGKASA